MGKNFCDLAQKDCASKVAACDADPHCRPQLTDCQQCTCFPTQHCLTGPDHVHGRPRGCVGKTDAGKALAKCLGNADDAAAAAQFRDYDIYIYKRIRMNKQTNDETRNETKWKTIQCFESSRVDTLLE